MIHCRPLTLASTVLSACLALFAGCSSSDSADDLVAPVGDSGGNTGEGGSGPDSATAGDGGGKKDSPSPIDAGPSLQPRLAPDLSVREVALFQAVKIPLARDGSTIPQRNAPVLADRNALFRIHIAPSPSFTPRFITAEVRLSTAGAEPVSFSSGMKIFGSSSDDVLGSAFDILVPGPHITTETTWSVRLVDDSAPLVEEGASHAARFPLDGSLSPLDARSDGPGLQLVLVPFRYDADGSGRLPDTSDAQIEVFRRLLTAVYPLVHADITVREPVVWDLPLWFGDVNFNELNDRLFDLKQQDGAPGQSYYYGLISPADSLDAYCKYTCVTGQSYVVDEPDAGDYRIGAGMGFSGEDSGWTLVHEMGHLHGRLHAPCEVSQWDDDYPYADGGTGVWGWDPRSGLFQDPKHSFDLMGYCEPAWISDYTYAALFERIQQVGALRSRSPSSESSGRFLHVSEDGSARWGRDVMTAANAGGPAIVRFLAHDGTVIAQTTSRAVRRSGGGYSVLVPRVSGDVAAVELAGDVPRSVRLTW